MKRTVIIGASDNPERYAYKATEKLMRYGHEVFPVGLRNGQIKGKEIITDKNLIADIDTVTLYVGKFNQEPWMDFIFGLNPKRIIFNPGTENPELEKKAQEKGIETVEGCTLVMLSTGTY